MFDKALNFIDVAHVLEELGFRHGTASAEEAKAPVPQIVFIHEPTDTLFVFPATTAIVDPARVESIRRILIGRGVCTEKRINDLLENRQRKTVA